MTRQQSPHSIHLIVACDAGFARASKTTAVVERLVDAGLPLTLAVDEQGIAAYRQLAVEAQRRIALVPLMPGTKESPSLESRLAACRSAAGEVHAIYVPVGTTLHGAMADLKRLGVFVVVDESNAGRRGIPGHVQRMAIDAIAPGATFVQRIHRVPIVASAADATIVLSGIRLEQGGVFAARQTKGLIADLQRVQSSGAAVLAPVGGSGTGAVRRATPQQSILRAA